MADFWFIAFATVVTIFFGFFIVSFLFFSSFISRTIHSYHTFETKIKTLANHERFHAVVCLTFCRFNDCYWRIISDERILWTDLHETHAKIKAPNAQKVTEGRLQMKWICCLFGAVHMFTMTTCSHAPSGQSKKYNSFPWRNCYYEQELIAYFGLWTEYRKHPTGRVLLYIQKCPFGNVDFDGRLR